MANAKKRFDSLQKRLTSNDVLKKEYERKMLNYIEQEHIEWDKHIKAPLPAERLTPCKPFNTTGIDFVGPVYVRGTISSKKSYIPLSTCSTIRALHIELVSNLTNDRFLMAFRRFVGRRELSHTIYTDNATTSQDANKDLITFKNTLKSKNAQQFYAENGIRWKFIVPREAWWGDGGKGVEAAINSRSLVHEEGIGDTEEALTPGHFLTGQKLIKILSGPQPTDKRFGRIFEQQQDLLNQFWKKWSKDYLLQLRTFDQVLGNQNSSKIRIGDVVLLQENVPPRHTWNRARVDQLILGRDEKVRTCVLRANGRTITRPVQLVIPLEVDQGREDVASLKSTNLK
ncbi:integrase catalytic domain-containing protein [Trichonephila clavata]|uniref:Integrase catalytic domain-containing protein n=1 Tax=Trichonephila clavata TaxID=2740835 RepID=A0A8X6HEL3_TRICU|nr:integrase catalytic domain-containing protein [Trichonephila clavata]